jgi:hypothetical protein
LSHRRQQRGGRTGNRRERFRGHDWPVP